jgi:FkbM family methyltransferase
MRAQYRRNKAKTLLDIIRRIDNWPTAIDLRLRRHRRGLRLLNFRAGLNVVCRGGSRDWDAIHELLFAGSYQHALDYLRARSGRQMVLDLGGNIGLFSLQAALQSPEVFVHAYEPGPPNCRLFEMNRLLNYPLSERIVLHCEAVAGESRAGKLFFDERNPAGSSLFAGESASFDVKISSFANAIATAAAPIALVKIDIEGTEFDLLERTAPEVWKSVAAIALEVHDDPSGKMTRQQFIERLCSYGFEAEEEKVCSYFLRRR